MASPTLKLGSEEFDLTERKKAKKKPSRADKFYKKHVAPRRLTILLALAGSGLIGYGMFKEISCASSMVDSWQTQRQAQKAEEAQQVQEKQTPKASLNLKVKAKHDGHGKISNFEIENIPEIDGCGTEHIVLPNIDLEKLGQGIYKITVVLAAEAHGRDIGYRFSFEIDDKDYDFMPVEATLVQ